MITGACVLSVLFLLASCAHEERFRLEGRVDTRYNDSLVTLFTFLGNRIRSVDSAYVADGRFRFEGPEYLYEESLVSLGNYPDSVFSVGLFLCEGDIEVELKRQPVVRSRMVDEYKAFVDSSRVLYSRTFTADEAKRKAVGEAEWKRRLDEYWKFRYEFKIKHLGDGLGRKVFAEDAYFSGEPYTGELYNLMPERDRNRLDVKRHHAQWEKSNRWEQMKGKPFPDFTLTDSSGMKRKISDYVGKYDYLLLDFWASWCGPCRAAEPKLKQLLKDYGDKGFGIVTISLDKNKESWLDLLKRDKRPWVDLCISNPEDYEKICELYNIRSIPFGILIDKAGKIISVVHPLTLEYWLSDLLSDATFAVKP